MTDRFTRGFDGERHKGRRIGTIYAASWIEGDVTLSEYFDGLDSLAKADILRDVIGLLERERQLCWDEFYASLPSPADAT